MLETGVARTDLLGCLSHSRNISGMPGGNFITSGININSELRMNSLQFTNFFGQRSLRSTKTRFQPKLKNVCTNYEKHLWNNKIIKLLHFIFIKVKNQLHWNITLGYQLKCAWFQRHTNVNACLFSALLSPPNICLCKKIYIKIFQIHELTNNMLYNI